MADDNGGEFTQQYTDFLERISEAGGEFKWIMQRRNFPENLAKLGCLPPGQRRTPDQIIQDVLRSERVQSTIAAEVQRRQCAEKNVRAEAEQILCTMAHRLQMSAMRMVGYAIVSSVKRLFDGIFVNSAQLERIRELSSKNAIVFIPTHRTYMDFLLVSLLCFDSNIPMPAIVAGEDFMASKFMGEALRRCGAFFIRRHFGNDALYWSIFAEYVQTHLINGDHPMEFFVEGTRSRSGKSLHPKYGLLQIMIEPFLRCQIYDVMIVPVTINYDKILEETLYAYELLGFKKPKETTSGLLKARSIFERRFGRVYMTFAEPVSVRQYFSTSLSRSSLACMPQSMFKIPECGKAQIRRLGHSIVEIHNRNNITTIWPYACTVLLKLLDERRMSGRSEVIRLSEIISGLEEFVLLAKQLKRTIHFRMNLNSDLRYYLNLHSSLFSCCGDFASPQTIIELVEFPINEKGFIDANCLQRSVAYVIVTNYANQMLYSFADLAIICAIVMAQKGIRYDDAKSLFSRLRSLFEYEFVCLPDENDAFNSFDSAIELLMEASFLDIYNDSIVVRHNDTVSSLASLIYPFICVYELVMLTAFRFAGTTASQQLLLVGTQRRIAQMLSSKPQVNIFLRPSALSLDPMKNAISALYAHNALIKQSNGEYAVDSRQLNSLATLLQSISPYKMLFDSDLAAGQSKL